MRSGVLLFSVVGCLLLGGAARLAHLEIRDGPTLRARAERQQTASWVIPSQRGTILDSQGRVLAGTIRRPGVFVDPAMVTDVRLTAASLGPILGVSVADLQELIASQREKRFVWLKREVTEEQLEAFEQVRRTRGLPGLGVQQIPQRVYPYGRLAAHLLGFVGAEQRGLAGIEQSFDSVLAGVDGRGESSVDTRRRRVRTHQDEIVPPRDGASVVLTIDAYLQQRLEEHLRTAVERFKAKWGTAVLMEPRSGEILAMAVVPDFDPIEPMAARPGDASDSDALARVRNRSIADAYEPGSIFKPFIAACALEDGLTRLDEIFSIDGPTRMFGRRSIRDTHAYDRLTMHEVLSKSSNIGMGILGGRVGNERLHEYVRRFGFGDATDLPLPGEHTGLVQDFPKWTGYSTQSIPIGQEIAVTPIQVVTAFSVFANGGLLVRPRVVRGVISPDGQTIEDNSTPIALRRVLSESVATRVRWEALAEVCVSGTGTNAAIADYQMFGKTGTAQVARRDGRGYIPGAYVGSFVGGAPLREPRAVVLVSLYHPTGGKYYGGTVAAPAAGAIVADALLHMRVPPEPLLPTAGRSADAD